MPDLTRRELLRMLVAGSARAALPAAAIAKAAAVSSGEREAGAAASAVGGDERFDFDWRFHLGDACDPARDFGFGADLRTYAKAGAHVADAVRLDFDDAGWDPVDLPHDWAVALPFVTGAATTGDDPAAAHGYKPLGRAYPATSIGWYRRVFAIARDDLGQRITLQFDGVFRDCQVFCNGHVVGRNASGYCGFEVDLSDVLDYGGRNVIAVRVDATLGEGWFYEGAGIYRHVWLRRTDPVHLARDGTFVRSDLQDRGATLSLSSELRNAGAAAGDCRVAWTVLAPDGRELARVESAAARVEPDATCTLSALVQVARPALWSPDSPRLHLLRTQLLSGDRVIDAVETRFGIRRFGFDAQRGFLLNGAALKLKGTCNHQDHAGVGSAIPDRLHEWRVAQLKSMGANAYRSAHNPPTPELLDACDRLGMLVIDETRRMASDAEGLGELERLIRRDRNRACVMAWSLGNEEPQMTGARGARIVRRMKRLANRLDPSRACTFAMDKGWGRGVSDVVDVIGFNYRIDRIDDFHARFPDKPVFGSETGSTVATRGVYRRRDDEGFVRAYDLEHPWWASTAEAWWSYVAQRPYIAGGFVWTGFDYRGEPTPFNHWPNVASQFGVLDSCGFPKDGYWYYRAQWTSEPVLHLFPHWNWQGLLDAGANGRVDVWCYSNLDAVELLVNGVSQGRQDVPPYGHVEWRVAYLPGVIEARGFRGGRLVATRRRETTGAAARVRLRSERTTLAADGRDVCVVAVEILDANGRIVPTASNAVAFEVDGAARLIGVGNGNPVSHESDKAAQRRAFNGRCMAIVQAARRPGVARLRAMSPGLGDTSLTITLATP